MLSKKRWNSQCFLLSTQNTLSKHTKYSITVQTSLVEVSSHIRYMDANCRSIMPRDAGNEKGLAWGLARIDRPGSRRRVSGATRHQMYTAHWWWLMMEARLVYFRYWLERNTMTLWCLVISWLAQATREVIGAIDWIEFISNRCLFCICSNGPFYRKLYLNVFFTVTNVLVLYFFFRSTQ